MHNTLITGFSWLLLASLMEVAGAAQASAQPQPDFETFERRVQAATNEWRVPGLAIAIVKDDATVFVSGQGTTSLTGGRPVDGDTLFSIGSTTKAITAAAIGLLVDEGKLGWNDPVARHLPEFRLASAEASALLRVRDLLTHNFGVPNTDVLWYEQPNSLDEILARMQHVDLVAPVYRDFAYQNVMYAAAGKLIEVVSEQPWHTFIETRIFKPLGMDRSVATLARTALRDNVASPHFVIDGAVTTISNASVDSVAAAGSIWSSVHDMALWARSLLRGCTTPTGAALLQPATCSELFKPHAIINTEMYPAMRLYDHQWFTYALGWFQTDYRGRALNFHSGSIDGLVALVGLVRAENLGVIVLGNLDHAEVRHALMYSALDLYDQRIDQLKPRDWNREIKDLFDGIATLRAAANSARRTSGSAAEDSKRPALKPESYIGTYTDPFFGRVSVTGSGNALILRYGRLSCTLEHLGADSFQCSWDTQWRGGSPIQFIPTNEATAAALRFGGAEFIRSP